MYWSSEHTCDTKLIDPNKRGADQIIGVRFEEHLLLQVGHCDQSIILQFCTIHGHFLQILLLQLGNLKIALSDTPK